MHLERLISNVSRLAAAAAPVALPVDGCLVLRQETPSALDASLYDPVLCLVLQGRKEVAIAGRTVSFGTGECLLVSHDLPVTSSITEVPYLALVFRIDVATVRHLAHQVAEAGIAHDHAQAAETHQAGPDLLDALGRYVALADHPAEAKVLGPLVATEIHYRLLMAPFGGMLRCLTRPDSHASAIARAIGHIREDIQSPIAVPLLARRVGMSASSFHKHFRSITATTPLQYQKELRLLEARRLLRSGGASVTSAALEVGYESPSQFSREYTRKFGVTPSQESANATEGIR